MPTYQAWFDIAILVIGALLGLVRRADVDKLKDMGDTIRANSIRHEELEKTVDKHRESTVESTHNIRTLIGTEYVTKAEFMRALDRIDARMDKGFADVVLSIRQLLVDMGITKK